MIHRKNRFSAKNLPPFQQHFLTEDMLLFDIETTGLSAERDPIYCIGCGYRREDDILIELFFAENPSAEPEILSAFFTLLENHGTLLTFNGNSFDIPFLRKRASRYESLYLGDPFSEQPGSVRSGKPALSGHDGHGAGYTFIDLYREALGMKSLLLLPSYRQKSIERFLGCQRVDPYDGGELIGIYHRYVTAPNAESLSILLQHNEEDVRGMFDLIGLLSWQQLRDGRYEITESKTERMDRSFCSPDETSRYCDKSTGYDEISSYYNIKIRSNFAFPKGIRVRDKTASLLLDQEIGQIRFPIRRGILKYFFSEPENYYYLPEEDCAVHKSVGSFVDSAHRRKATLKNCYTKKECDYISVPVKSENSSPRKEYRDSHSFLVLPAQTGDVKEYLLKYFSLFFGK
ncbi:MAG: ribonuclease H-like domain-containing protein [Clostridiales bacterium]|nr:ribonuclease H-like domain-containing protein [Clostridiales bacterium]